MDLKVILSIGAVLAAWIMLSVIGGERHRKVVEFEANRPPRPPAKDTPKAADKTGVTGGSPASNKTP